MVETRISRLSLSGSNTVLLKPRVPPIDPLLTSPTLRFLPYESKIIAIGPPATSENLGVN